MKQQNAKPSTMPTAPTETSNKSEGNNHDLLRGLIYMHNRANANTAEVHEAKATLQAMIELLVESGIIDGETLKAKCGQASEQLRREYVERGMAVAMQEFGISKYEFKGGAEINCENRIHLCKAACCRLPLALSKEDVQEGVVKWDLGQPYMNLREAEGYCMHLDRCTGNCTVYEQRPILCRGYDCREDKRIWLDFEKGVINPRVGESDWPECIKTQMSKRREAVAWPNLSQRNHQKAKAPSKYRSVRLSLLASLLSQQVPMARYWPCSAVRVIAPSVSCLNQE